MSDWYEFAHLQGLRDGCRGRRLDSPLGLLSAVVDAPHGLAPSDAFHIAREFFLHLPLHLFKAGSILRTAWPEGTVFSAKRPAPISTYYEGMAHAVELVWKALAPHVEHRVTAGHMISTCVTIISGLHPVNHDFFVYVETLPGGWGAGHDKDGVDGTGCVANGETYNIPVEVKETKFGFRVRRYEFNGEVGGAGQYRGGKGMVLEYEITAEFATLTGIFGRHVTPPWGLNGGGNGTCNKVEITRKDGTEEIHGRIAGVALQKGDLVRLITGTAGGYGDPLMRERAQVQADLKDGYITPDQAKTIYGL